ncbi:porin [Paraburkholderia agricolaris]|uniref:Porin n=1 Tax=Paraburkholderia agricolaris TaxID=2152888 RepID=A0ABW8ZWE6_9BURK
MRRLIVERKFSQSALAIAAMLAAVPSFAQSSVTLYGVVDNSLLYQSSQTSLGSTSGGHSVVKLQTAMLQGSGFGMLGVEDLGGGTKAIFKLDALFNANTGAQAYGGAGFNRQSWVGFTNPQYGKITVGRQYSPYFSLLVPYNPVNYLGGFVGAHPGDVDAMDTIWRVNSSVAYISPQFAGFTIGGMYAFGGVAGSVNSGSTWSGAVQYAAGPVGIAAGVLRINNSTAGGGAYGTASTVNSNGEVGISAVTNGYQTAQAQQRVAVAAGYTFNSAWDVSATYANVQYIPGIRSAFTSTATFNVAGAVLHWHPQPSIDLAASYSYTRATASNGISDPAQYHQGVLFESYSVSKNTVLYALQAFQRSSGKTLGTAGAGDFINATATIGDGLSPSSSRSQLAASIGVVHRF